MSQIDPTAAAHDHDPRAIEAWRNTTTNALAWSSVVRLGTWIMAGVSVGLLILAAIMVLPKSPTEAVIYLVLIFGVIGNAALIHLVCVGVSAIVIMGRQVEARLWQAADEQRRRPVDSPRPPNVGVAQPVVIAAPTAVPAPATPPVAATEAPSSVIEQRPGESDEAFARRQQAEDIARFKRGRGK